MVCYGDADKQNHNQKRQCRQIRLDKTRRMCLFVCMHSHFIFIYFFVFVLLNFFCDSEASTPAPRVAFPLSIGYAHCVFSHSPYCTQVTAAADRSFSWTETIA